MGAGCKLIQDAGLKEEFWSTTAYKENSLLEKLSVVFDGLLAHRNCFALHITKR